MGGIAFVFSGQGDQYPGMGKELVQKYPAAASVYEMCDSLRPGTSAQCFEGTEEELKETVNTQPCLFAMELSAALVLLQQGARPLAVAGFSLGEMVAATVSGILSPETGFRLVCRRGELMQLAADRQDTSMAAVVKLTAREVEELCGRYSAVYPVNYNCPGQITVSGLSAQMADFCADVKKAGGRAIPLKVKGGFHSPFMEEAAEAFREELERVDIREGRTVLYSNVTGMPYGEDVRELLSRQICSPVQWERLIRNMADGGIDTFVEIGPGRTLTNMIRKIDNNVKALTVTEYMEGIYPDANL